MDKSLGIIEISINKTLTDYFATIGVLTDITSLFTDKELAELSRIVTGTKIPFFHIRLEEDNGEGGVYWCVYKWKVLYCVCRKYTAIQLTL